MRNIPFLLIRIIILAFVLPFSANAEDMRLFAHKADIGSSHAAVIRLLPAEGCYTYAPSDDERIYPTTIRFTPDQQQASASGQSVSGSSSPRVLFPAGVPKYDAGFDGTVSVYDADTPVFLDFGGSPVPDGTVAADMLVCSPVRCSPYSAVISLNDVPELPLPEPYAALFSELSSKSPQQGGTQAEKNANDGKIPGGYSFSPTYAAADIHVSSLFSSILLGILAGFILNFMPCVLPVISLKLLSLFPSGQGNAGLHAFRRHLVFFSLGILVWFAMLGVILIVTQSMLGSLFQNRWIIVALCVILTVLAISLFDVVQLPVFGGRSSGGMGSFASGFFCTLLATPCSGPLLGGVLAFALTSPPHAGLAVFLSVGIGMAFPYLLLFVSPSLIAKLPAPGPWLDTLRHAMAFLLLATVLYLLSILQESVVIPVLMILLLTAVLCAAWGHWVAFRRTRRFRLAMAVLFLAITAAFSGIVLKKDDSASFTSFDAVEFRNNLGTRAMLVEFTADWCPTCKVLEKTVLTKDFIGQLIKKHSLLFIKADMTASDPDLENLLKSLGTYSIPALALFPAGENNSHPVILRDLYTQTQVKDMLKSALD